jgi:hypothetical protein
VPHRLLLSSTPISPHTSRLLRLLIHIARNPNPPIPTDMRLIWKIPPSTIGRITRSGRFGVEIYPKNTSSMTCKDPIAHSPFHSEHSKLTYGPRAGRWVRVQLYFSTIHLTYPFLCRSRFLANLRHGSYRTRPAYALIYAIFAIAAPYHVDLKIRAHASHWYSKARKFMDLGHQLTIDGYGKEDVRRLMTVEMVQAACLLTLIDTGNGDNQVRRDLARSLEGNCIHVVGLAQLAFMTIGKAARMAAMLGLYTSVCPIDSV